MVHKMLHKKSKHLFFIIKAVKYKWIDLGPRQRWKRVLTFFISEKDNCGSLVYIKK